MRRFKGEILQKFLTFKIFRKFFFEELYRKLMLKLIVTNRNVNVINKSINVINIIIKIL